VTNIPGGPRPRRYVIADLLNDYLLEALLIAVPAMTGVAALVYSDEFTHAVTSSKDRQADIRFYGILAFAALTLFQIVLAVLNLRRAHRISLLERTIETERARADAAEQNSAAWVQDIYSLCDGYLYVMATRRGLGFTSSDRISLYSRDPTTESFLMLGRYSSNEEYRQIGRKFYPTDQGFIGRAWLHEECCVADFPSRSLDEAGFLDECAKLGIGKDVAMRLRMPSRFFFGRKIRDLSGTRALGVVMIESTTARRFAQNDLREVFNGSDGFQLRNLMERIAPRVPNGRIATDAGF
jgi:hypothetical protein